MVKQAVEKGVELKTNVDLNAIFPSNETTNELSIKDLFGSKLVDHD